MVVTYFLVYKNILDVLLQLGCNTLFCKKEHINCATIDLIVVTLKLGTLINCVTIGLSNTFLDILQHIPVLLKVCSVLSVSVAS